MFYKVVSPFLAVREGQKPQGFITLPEGAILELAGELTGQSLVTIRFEHETLQVFTRDLKDRAIPEQGAG